MTVSARKRRHRVSLSILRPFDVLQEGKPLGESWGGGWVAQPGLLSAARS